MFQGCGEGGDGLPRTRPGFDDYVTALVQCYPDIGDDVQLASPGRIREVRCVLVGLGYNRGFALPPRRDVREAGLSADGASVHGAAADPAALCSRRHEALAFVTEQSLHARPHGQVRYKEWRVHALLILISIDIDSKSIDTIQKYLLKN